MTPLALLVLLFGYYFGPVILFIIVIALLVRLITEN